MKEARMTVLQPEGFPLVSLVQSVINFDVVDKDMHQLAGVGHGPEPAELTTYTTHLWLVLLVA